MTMPGCLDERVRERILAEARGNPLALLELHTDLTPADVAGGYGLAEARPLTHRIESSFTTQLRELPSSTRQLLLIAAADPVGSAALLLRAAERLGLGVDDAAPAEAAGLMTIGTGCTSGTRWCARRSTGLPRWPIGDACIRRSPTRPIRDTTWSFGPGIARRRPPMPTNRSRTSSPAAPSGRGRGAASRRLPHS